MLCIDKILILGGNSILRRRFWTSPKNPTLLTPSNKFSSRERNLLRHKMQQNFVVQGRKSCVFPLIADRNWSKKFYFGFLHFPSDENPVPKILKDQTSFSGIHGRVLLQTYFYEVRFLHNFLICFSAIFKRVKFELKQQQRQQPLAKHSRYGFCYFR